MTFEVREQGVTASGYDYYDVFGAKWDETYPDELLPEAHENPYKNQPRREAIYELTDPFGKICQGHKQIFFDKFISSLFLS